MNDKNEVLIQVQDLKKAFGKLEVLRGISTEIKKGDLRQNKKDRYMLNAGLSYKILDWLTVSGRVRLDNSNNDYTEKFYASTNTQLTESSSRGLYGITKTQDKQLYADFLVSINKYFGEDWSLQANVGGSFSDIRSDAMKTRGPIADGGDAFSGERQILPNLLKHDYS